MSKFDKLSNKLQNNSDKFHNMSDRLNNKFNWNDNDLVVFKSEQDRQQYYKANNLKHLPYGQS